jgi:tRNA modification GTPase
VTGHDTIFALSTAPGRSGVAVVRISGLGSRAALSALGGPGDPKARHASLVDLKSPGDGEAIDRALVLWFPGPHSFTGEDVVELHLHGGPVVVRAALEALAGQDGLRPAEPGEFTAALTEDWRHRLLAALAQVEAAIDFPDEDLPPDAWIQAKDLASELKNDISQYLDQSPVGERLRHGYQIAIVGAPNVGKSSLLNALASRDAAIVAETAGTTRDVIEVHLDLGGYPVTLVDTAGLREEIDGPPERPGRPDADTIDAVEIEGMRRARLRAESADLKLVVADVRDWPNLGPGVEALIDETAVLVLNKLDLAPVSGSPGADRYRGRPLFAISAREGTGLGGLLDHLRDLVTGDLGVSGSAPSLTRVRHRRALEECRDSLDRSIAADEVALAAEDLRLAIRALGRITGRVDVEDLLDVIFKDFCIGK